MPHNLLQLLYRLQLTTVFQKPQLNKHTLKGHTIGIEQPKVKHDQAEFSQPWCIGPHPHRSPWVP